MLSVLSSYGALATAEGTEELSKSGGVCETNADCEGNLDCTGVGLLQSKRCFPVTCAKGAAAAVVDSGFKADQYLATVKSKAGVNSDREFMTLDEAGNVNLVKAIATTRPPMEVFNANYTACLHPEETRRSLQFGGVDDDEFLDKLFEVETLYGLQWSGAALLSYYGKSTWWAKEDIIEVPDDDDDFPYDDLDFNFQQLSNCVGVLLGGDFGLDVLFQIPDENYYKLLTEDIFFAGQDIDEFEEKPEAPTIETRHEVGNTQFVPVIVAGPIGVSVGWDQTEGPDSGTITEVTIGASFGAALGGFAQCYNHVYFNRPGFF